MTILDDLTYTVCETSESSSTATRSDDEKVTQTASVSYIVIVEAEGDPADTDPILPHTVSTDLIRTCPELPLVNGSTYNYGGTKNPYLICSGKTVTRDPDNRLKFDVTCEFSTQAPSDSEQGDEDSQDPVDLDDIEPTVSVTIGYIEKPIYTDMDGEQCFMLPSKTPYPSPVMQKVPTLTLVITQYEPSITFATMLERSYKLNSDNYRTAGPHMWMTQAVKASTVEVELAGGPQTAAKVTYTLVYSDASFITTVTGEPNAADGEPAIAAGTEYFYGHSTTKPLVDTHYYGYIDSEGEYGRVPITDPITDEPTTGYIYSKTGKYGQQRHPDTNNAGVAGEGEDRPSYVVHRTQEAISFNFLQV